jgi:HicA toxin of bacterial toxin-antitoxin,
MPNLRQHGFQRVRQRGSHVVMQKRTTDSTVTVPIPLHNELRRACLVHSSNRPLEQPRFKSRHIRGLLKLGDRVQGPENPFQSGLHSPRKGAEPWRKVLPYTY